MGGTDIDTLELKLLPAANKPLKLGEIVIEHEGQRTAMSPPSVLKRTLSKRSFPVEAVVMFDTTPEKPLCTFTAIGEFKMSITGLAEMMMLVLF